MLPLHLLNWAGFGLPILEERGRKEDRKPWLLPKSLNTHLLPKVQIHEQNLSCRHYRSNWQR